MPRPRCREANRHDIPRLTIDAALRLRAHVVVAAGVGRLQSRPFDAQALTGIVHVGGAEHICGRRRRKSTEKEGRGDVVRHTHPPPKHANPPRLGHGNETEATVCTSTAMTTKKDAQSPETCRPDPTIADDLYDNQRTVAQLRVSPSTQHSVCEQTPSSPHVAVGSRVDPSVHRLTPPAST